MISPSNDYLYIVVKGSFESVQDVFYDLQEEFPEWTPVHTEDSLNENGLVQVCFIKRKNNDKK